MAKKIRGRFCERTAASKRSFDRRSFRWVRRGRNWLLIGCPRGKWKPRAQRCKVGTRAHKILKASRGSCAVGAHAITKR